MPSDEESRQSRLRKINIDRYVPAQVTLLANKLSTGASACYRKHFGVGIVEWRLLALLAIESPQTANRMCQTIGIDKAAVSRALKLMEASGHVQSSSDPDDARRVIIHLTDSGRALQEDILTVAMKREELLLADFTETELETLLSLLRRMHGRVEIVNDYEPETISR